jgi:hypothetical protein
MPSRGGRPGWRRPSWELVALLGSGECACASHPSAPFIHLFESYLYYAGPVALELLPVILKPS